MSSPHPTHSRPNTCCGCAKPQKPSSPTSSQEFRALRRAEVTCDGKVALVTGTSRGLGKAIAKRLAAEGATVALTARTAEPDPKYQGSLHQTLKEIEAVGGSAVAIPTDLSSPDERERLFGEVIDRIGAPDILVNNAAVTFLRPL